MFGRIKRKRERKNALDGHEYEEYFLTEEQEAVLKRFQELSDAIIAWLQEIGVNAAQAAAALSDIFGSNSIEVDEKKIARDRSRADLNAKRCKMRRGKNRHVIPTGRK